MPQDKRVMIEFTCDWKVDDVAEIVDFLQEALETARGISRGESDGKYLEERLVESAYLKEVVGARLLQEGEYMAPIKTSLVQVQEPEYHR